ncbi:MAG: SPOR domain-containing protein [Flavobacteriales bacterium]
MGSTFVAEISIPDFTITRKIQVGIHPRHISGPVGDSLLLVSLNGEASVAIVSLINEKVKKIFTGTMPRSMALSADGEYAYVVNYGDNTFSKISISKKKRLENCPTQKNPVGISVHPITGEIWVACYSGFIQLFSDSDYDPNRISKKTQISEVEFGIPTESVSTAFTGFLTMFSSTEKKAVNVNETATPVTKTTVAVTQAVIPPADHGYYLVAGAFRSKDNAMRLKQKLSVHTQQTQLLPQEQKGLTYVAIGPFKTKEDANTSVEETSKKTGETCWVYYY